MKRRIDLLLGMGFVLASCLVAGLVQCLAGERPPGTGAADPGAGRASTLTLETVQRSAVDALKRLSSLEVEYKATIRTRGKTEGDHFFVRRLAAKENRRYLKTRILVDRGQGAIEEQHAYHSYYDGKSWDVYYPHSHRYEVAARFVKHPSAMKAVGEPFLECIAWFPPGDKSTPPAMSGRPFFLQHLFGKEKCRLLPQQQQFEGEWCHGIEVPGLDLLWIANSSGTLMRRNRLDPAKGKPFMEYVLKDHREVAPGIVLPYRIVRIERSVLDGAVLLEMNYTVLDAEVNAVPDALFDFRPAPGTLIYDRDSDTQKQVPGGLSFLEEISGRVVAGSGTRAAPRTLSAFLVIALGMTAVGCVSCLVVRRSKALFAPAGAGREKDGVPGVSSREGVSRR